MCFLRIVLVLAVLCGVPHGAPSQIRPSRSVFVEPLQRPAEAGPAASSWFIGEGYRGWGSVGDEQAWQYRLHGGVEAYRWENVTTTLQLHHELTANPFSSIGFNPRGARWEEELLVHVQPPTLPDLYLQTGWFHRCKHDIDNNEPAREGDPAPFVPTTRVIILSGPKLSVAQQNIATFLGTLGVQAGGEWYVVAEDYRTPYNAIGSWEHLQAMLWLRLHLRYDLGERWRLGATYYVAAPFWSSRTGAPQGAVETTLPPHDARAEITLSAVSKTAAWSIVAAAETQFDEVVFLGAQPTTVWQVGLRIGMD